MKRLCIALLIAFAVACGGGGDNSDPIQPIDDTPPFEVVSGTFDMNATIGVNGCDRETEWDGMYDVQIDSISFAMGNFTGSWNPRTKLATGETEHVSHTTRDCTVTTWTTVYMTFKSENAYVGSVVYRLRLRGDCGDRPTCTTSWTISGFRQAP